MTIDLEKMEYLFSVSNPTKLFITHISNVTGYILPVKQIVKIAKKYNCKVIIDASQSLGNCIDLIICRRILLCLRVIKICTDHLE